MPDKLRVATKDKHFVNVWRNSVAFFKLFSSRFSSIGRQIPSADKQSDATGDAV